MEFIVTDLRPDCGLIFAEFAYTHKIPFTVVLSCEEENNDLPVRVQNRINFLKKRAIACVEIDRDANSPIRSHYYYRSNQWIPAGKFDPRKWNSRATAFSYRLIHNDACSAVETKFPRKSFKYDLVNCITIQTHQGYSSTCSCYNCVPF